MRASSPRPRDDAQLDGDLRRRHAGLHRPARTPRRRRLASSSSTSAMGSSGIPANSRERFASDGFAAAAPDLYFTHPDQEALHRGDANCDVADPDALIALEAVIDLLATIPQADTGRLAVMGICQTARLPLIVAAPRPIAAALVWYGAAQPREWAVSSKYPRAARRHHRRGRLPGARHVRRDRPSHFGRRRPPLPRLPGAAPQELQHPSLPRCAARLAQRHHAGPLSPRPGASGLGRPARLPRRGARARLRPDRRGVQRYAADIATDYDFSRNVRHE